MAFCICCVCPSVPSWAYLQLFVNLPPERVSGSVYLACAPVCRVRLPSSVCVSVSVSLWVCLWSILTPRGQQSAGFRVRAKFHLLPICEERGSIQAEGMQANSRMQDRAGGWAEAVGGQGGCSRGSNGEGATGEDSRATCGGGAWSWNIVLSEMEPGRVCTGERQGLLWRCLW